MPEDAMTLSCRLHRPCAGGTQPPTRTVLAEHALWDGVVAHGALREQGGLRVRLHAGIGALLGR
eukprot:7261259-Alexandrium_andersonii.AAC.1